MAPSLRASSTLRVPGRYQEDLGPSRADRPLYAHPDVPFNPELVQHCAHPSLPLDYLGLGPSEAEKLRRAASAAAQTAAENDSDESLEAEQENGEVVVVSSDDTSTNDASVGTESGSDFEDGVSARSRGRRGLANGRQAPPSLQDLIVDLTISEPGLHGGDRLVREGPTTPVLTPAAPPTPSAPTRPATRPARVARIRRRNPASARSDERSVQTETSSENGAKTVSRLLSLLCQ